jgi:hypothetical protein
LLFVLIFREENVKNGNCHNPKMPKMPKIDQKALDDLIYGMA